MPLHAREMTLRLMVLGLAGLVLAACANSGPQTPFSPTDTDSPAVPVASVTDAPPTLGPTAAPAVDYCLECHTDQQRLTDTAELEVETESESKGVG